MSRTRPHGPLCVLGDMGARFGPACEHADVVGPSVLGPAGTATDARSNQNVLVEVCTALHMVLAGAFLDKPDDQGDLL
eukprot:2680791-Pyramimonas_sp.AAC.1